MKLFRSTFLIFTVLILGNCAPPKEYVDFPILKKSISAKGMVVSAHPLATRVGLKILEQGGNAVDAAVAVQYALCVVFPYAGSLGGGGFMVIRMNDGTTATLDYREKAPGAAHRDMYLDENGNPDDKKSRVGPFATGVPGVVDGMEKAHQRFGKIKDLGTLIEPAIHLAKRGYALTHNQDSILDSHRTAFIKNNQVMPAYVKKEKWEKGDFLVQKDLARSLERIRKNGSKGFYEGETAQLIIDQMKRSNGIITKEDLRNYEAKWRDPIVYEYKNYTVISMPPTSSGGVALSQMLSMVEGYPLSDWGFQSTKSVHLMAEAERRAFADRSQHLGDIDFYPVPIKELTSKEYNKKRMTTFNPEAATRSDEIEAGVIPISGETSHFSIVDSYGNAVSNTTTINSAYGSKTVVDGGGFLLNNEMDDFSIKPGHPNMFGMVGGEANSIQPGKRMLSSMTPTIVLKDKKLHMVLGTPGGSTIITTVFQVILNVVEFGMTLQEAVQAPRFHHQWLPDKIFIEKEALSDQVINELQSMGHSVAQRGSMGRVTAILVDEKGVIEGAADRRRDDHAEGL